MAIRGSRVVISWFKFSVKWALVGVAGLGLAIAVLIFMARSSPVSLTALDGVVGLGVGAVLGADVEVEATQLFWSQKQNCPALRFDHIQLKDREESDVSLTHVSIEPSAEAIWDRGILALATISIGRVDIVSPDEQYLTAPKELFTGSGLGASNLDGLAYLQTVDIRNVNISSRGEAPSSRDTRASTIQISRDGDAFIGTLDLSYVQKSIPSRLYGDMRFNPEQGGFFELNLQNINPKDVGNFSRFLSPMRFLALPVSGQVSFTLTGDGRLDTGQAQINVSPGMVNLATMEVPFKALDMTLAADFSAQDFTLTKGYFDIGGAKGDIAGALYYGFSETGSLTHISTTLSGSSVTLDRPELFEAPILASKMNAQLSYNFSTQNLSIDDVSLNHDGGLATISGEIGLADGQPMLDISSRFSPMSREAVMRLWPLPAAKKSRLWAGKYLSRGQLVDGQLTLRASLDELVNRVPRTPLRADALQLDLSFEDLDVQYLKDMPPIQGTHAALRLNGEGLQVTAQGGTIALPEFAGETPPPLEISEARFDIDKFWVPGLPAKLRLTAQGSVPAVLREINKPPLRALRNLKFDTNRLQGDFAGTVDLSFNLANKVLRKPVDYAFDGRFSDLSVEGKLGRYQISNGRSHISLHNKGMVIAGRAVANDVDLGFEWRQPFGAKGQGMAGSRLALNADLSPQNAVDLGFDWAGTRFEGALGVRLLVEGPLDRPTDYRVTVDAGTAKLLPVPLAYEKPMGQASRIDAALKFEPNGKIKSLRMRGYVAGEEKLAAQVGFRDGVLSDLKMSPINLGHTEQVVFNLMSDAQGRRITIQGDKLDATALLDAGNTAVVLPEKPRQKFFSFLGDNALIEVQIDQVVGSLDETLDGLRLFVVRRDGLFEKVSLNGIFADGTELIGSIERANDTRRRYNLQTENASSLFRLVDVLEGMQGGSMMLQGQIFDDERDDHGDYMQSSGRFDLVSFRAREVPTLAKILSIGSFKGFADTLAGDGIAFDRAEFKFSNVDNLFRVKGGRVFGSAIGLTTQGDYDTYTSRLDFGGTVVPAYGINSFLSKIPIIGRILTGRKGEGVIGVGYRLLGHREDTTVIVNPLSILTPGIFRRIFEVGIGLSPDLPADYSPNLQAQDYPIGDP
jgi:hypothetical protein